MATLMTPNEMIPGVKVGDRVRCVYNAGPPTARTNAGFEVGKTYIVEKSGSGDLTIRGYETLSSRFEAVDGGEAGGLKVGDRVCRGPDWRWGGQGGVDPKGTVIDGASDPFWRLVRWDDGTCYSYRHGANSAYDLCLLRECKPSRATTTTTTDDAPMFQGAVKDDVVVKPAHYTRFAIEPITFIMRNKMSFWEGCIIKYVCRAGHKLYPGNDAAESEVIDLRKAIRYAEMRINQIEGEIEL